MSHEYKCGSILCCSVCTVISSSLNCLSSDCFCNCLLVSIYSRSVCSNLTKQRLSDLNRLKFILIVCNCLAKLIVLSTMHQMGRLYNQVLNTIIYSSLKCLIHVVNVLIITSLDMVDNDLCGKCTSYRPVRISLCKSILDAFDISYTAIVERSTKAYYQKLVLSDLILVTRIILGSISGVASEVIRISFFTFNQLFLSISQSIPCLFCCFTILIGSLSSFLNVDLIDQSCNLVCCCLVSICIFCCILSRSFCCLLSGLFGSLCRSFCCCLTSAACN